jgi:hypothetical protein
LLKRQDFQPLYQHDTDINSIKRGKGWGEIVGRRIVKRRSSRTTWTVAKI